jgi:hypothetical protein
MFGRIALKVASIIVTINGLICAFLLWFLPWHAFLLSGFTTGLALIFLNSLILIAEIKPSLLIEKYLNFLLIPYGRAGFLIGLGFLYADQWVFVIVCWVFYWVLAMVYIIIGLAGPPYSTELMTGGFESLPGQAPIGVAVTPIYVGGPGMYVPAGYAPQYVVAPPAGNFGGGPAQYAQGPPGGNFGGPPPQYGQGPPAATSGEVPVESVFPPPTVSGRTGPI